MTASWKKRSLAEVCQFINRGISPAYVDAGGVAVLNQKCVRDHAVNFDLGRRHDAAVKKVTAERLVRAGDVLVNSTGTGTLGRVAQLRDDPAEPTTVDSHVTIVRPTPGIFHPEFFGYALVAIEEQIQKGGEGCGGQTELSRSKLAEGYQVSFPEDQNEQRRIVAILDEAFEGIATAKANAEKNLQNVSELASRQLTMVLSAASLTGNSGTLETLVTSECSLSYGIVQPGDEVSGGLPVVRPLDLGVKIVRTEGLKRIDPALARSYSRTTLKGGDLLLCVRGTTGNVAIAELALAGANVTRGIVPIQFDPRQVSQSLGYYLLRSGPAQAQIRAKTYGTALLQINIADLRKLDLNFPPSHLQSKVVEQLDAMQNASDQLVRVYERKIAALDELKKALLQQAFTGQLASRGKSRNTGEPALQTTTPEFIANVIAFAHSQHERHKRDKTFGHVKAQKVLHLVESIAKIDLGRQPMRDAAGPNDFQHMRKAEDWARTHGFFDMVKRGEGYEFRKLSAFDERLVSARKALAPVQQQLERVVDLLVPMNTEEAEVFATVHAAWSNLLIDRAVITDDAIVFAAREGWHADKLRIPEPRFRTAIAQIRQQGLVPDGTAKYVGGQSSLL